MAECSSPKKKNADKTGINRDNLCAISVLTIYHNALPILKEQTQKH
jgi:hypothetical protein